MCVYFLTEVLKSSLTVQKEHTVFKGFFFFQPLILSVIKNKKKDLGISHLCKSLMDFSHSVSEIDWNIYQTFCAIEKSNI